MTCNSKRREYIWYFITPFPENFFANTFVHAYQIDRITMQDLNSIQSICVTLQKVSPYFFYMT